MFVCAVVHLFVRWLLGLLVVWLVFVTTPTQSSDIAPGSRQFEAPLTNPCFGFRQRTSLLGSAYGSWWLRAQELGNCCVCAPGGARSSQLIWRIKDHGSPGSSWFFGASWLHLRRGQEAPEDKMFSRSSCQRFHHVQLYRNDFDSTPGQNIQNSAISSKCQGSAGKALHELSGAAASDALLHA